MIKYIFFFCALILSLLPGCANAGEKTIVSLNQEFSLQIGQVAQIEDEDLEIRFEEVLEDSRCPRNATCVWAGRAACRISLIKSGAQDSLSLTMPGLTDEYSRMVYKGYELSFNLTPYPEAGKEILKDAYKLQLIITRLPALTNVLGSVIANPQSYEGKSITAVGYYRGWDLLHEANITPPVTRSDWVIKDATGAICVNANSKAGVPDGLLPSSIEATKTILEVKGIIHLTKAGQAYIDATSIVRIPQADN